MTTLASTQYHPDPFAVSKFKPSGRKVIKRLNTIFKYCDFSNATVLDLGCSGGYFAFHIAQHAKHVLAIDSDEELIQRNRQICRKHGITNLHFESAVISPEYIHSLKDYDVTLFLSVLHHIMAASDVYSTNKEENAGQEKSLEILRAIQAHTRRLVFEMGQSNELNEWVKNLPDMGKTPQVWIVENLLKPAQFENIRVIEPPDWQGSVGMVRKAIHANAKSLYVSRNPINRMFKRAIAYDTKDCRYMFVGQSQ